MERFEWRYLLWYFAASIALDIVFYVLGARFGDGPIALAMIGCTTFAIFTAAFLCAVGRLD
jgi:hypothetical protein